jgi:peptidylprolyl isomerase
MKNLIISIVVIILFVVGLIVLFRAFPPKEAIINEQDMNTSQNEEQVAGDTTNTTPVSEELLKTIVTEGTGEAIVAGKIAVVEYTGMFTDGTVFDSSIPRGKPFEFTVGAGQVIQGWDIGVLGMKVGEEARLVIPGKYAYGEQGAGDVIPPNATLIFDVKLVGIK